MVFPLQRLNTTPLDWTQVFGARWALTLNCSGTIFFIRQSLKGEACNIWRFSEETARSSGYSFAEFFIPLPFLPVNFVGLHAQTCTLLSSYFFVALLEDMSVRPEDKAALRRAALSTPAALKI